MSVIINPRGTGGSGKTELVRRIMASYGWEQNDPIERIYREARARPICYRLRHPSGGRSLVVVGHYEVTSGGCDTIGSLDEIFGLVDHYAGRGHDVLFEGLEVSRDYERSAVLAMRRGLYILRLDTPLDQCVRNLVARRRARRDAHWRIARITTAQHEEVEMACGRLGDCGKIEILSFDEALVRAGALLGIGPIPLLAQRSGKRKTGRKRPASTSEGTAPVRCAPMRR